MKKISSQILLKNNAQNIHRSTNTEDKLFSISRKLKKHAHNFFQTLP